MKNYIIKNVAIILMASMMLSTVGCVTLDVGEETSSDPSVVSTADVILPSEVEEESSLVDESSSSEEEAVTTKKTTTKKAATTTTKKTTTTTKATTTTVSADQKKEYANYWLSYAKKYAKSIGLEVISGRDGAYDTPISVEYPSSNTNIANAIKSDLNYYKSQGSTAVQLWLDTKLNNKYQLYIGY